MLIDEAEITVKGGHGGPGIVSFGKKMGSGPDGGNGGDGGDVYIRAVSDLTLLNQFSRQTNYEAEAGSPGGRNRQAGKDGKDLEILLPVGTTLMNADTNEEIFELKKVDQTELLCKGGKGGRGNYEFRSSTNTTPKYAQKGLPGQKLHLKIILKLIADFGLIGLPNAGKSSLLNELTRANAKIANYPFTTLSPNLGAFRGKILADIPGLIEGASEGRGLGISFLKHIEKVGVILHCLSCESINPGKDYQTVRNEMRDYDKRLLGKPEVILLTKSDLTDKKQVNRIVKLFSKKCENVLPVSIYDFDSIEELKKLLISLS